MSKKTAVEWLMEQCKAKIGVGFQSVMESEFQQAKQMERKQMIDFADNCQEMFLHQIVEKYTETYGGQNE